MRYFGRIQEPEILRDHWQRLGNKYAAKRALSSGYPFKWPTVNKIKIKHLILPLLRQQTQDHCSYCDRYFEFAGDASIDHFKPKSDERFYSLVCKWDNLYLCCDHCQREKGIVCDDDLLRPDAGDYSFDRYFVYNSRTNQIDINPGASPADKIKGEKTIEILKFNHPDYKKTRKKAIRIFNTGEFNVEEYHFRFLFE